MSDHKEPFNPEPEFAARLSTNRAGRYTKGQRNTIFIAAFGSLFSLLCIGVLVVNVVTALLSGIPLGSIVGIVFFVFFLLTFGYMVLTLYVNARMFLPDALSKQSVRQARGRLQIKMAERFRPELPFSYIVDDYSFAPYMVPPDVPMQEGREYVVYYAANSRMFLNIEPINSEE